jgi:hypothetical protein
MHTKLTTAAAAKFCTENGRRVSHRTLQKYRLKAPGDPGERGPGYMRDPVTGITYYLVDDLKLWIGELDARCCSADAVERGGLMWRGEPKQRRASGLDASLKSAGTQLGAWRWLIACRSISPVRTRNMTGCASWPRATWLQRLGLSRTRCVCMAASTGAASIPARGPCRMNLDSVGARSAITCSRLSMAGTCGAASRTPGEIGP